MNLRTHPTKAAVRNRAYRCKPPQFNTASSRRNPISLWRVLDAYRKGQFKLGTLRTKGKTEPEIWNAGLAA
jgi:hypothetical protein